MKNTLHVKFTTLFEKQRKSAPVEIRKIFLETLMLFLEDAHNQALRNHALVGKLAGFRSIDVTSDYRAIFSEKISRKETIITFHLFGTHKQLYGK